MRARSAPAKINLGLQVLRKRPDGYHDLSTVFLPIGWKDRVTVEVADRLSVKCDEPGVPTDERNLVWRAAEAYGRLMGREPKVQITLEKNIPHGAGLGGGSSDAAATLLLLRDLYGDALTLADLHPVATALGADVPFFVRAEPALASGIGDQLTALRRDEQPYRFPFHLCVAVPDVYIPTPQAFGQVVPRETDRPNLEAAVVSNDLERWRAELQNDFQRPMEALHPAIRRVRLQLLEAGAAFASLSGSGSAVFGVFGSAGAAGSASAQWEGTATRAKAFSPPIERARGVA